MAKLTNLKINEVSFCKLGMNQHAKVALFKSADRLTGPRAIAKATFQEALRSQLVGDAVSDVFWDAFDKQWAVREAFATAMTDELENGGDGTQATEGFIGAMRTIAETAVSLVREASTDPTNQDLESAVEQAVEKWLEKETSDMKITTKAALKAAVAAFDPATSPAAHIGIIQKAATDLKAEDELPEDGPLAKAKQDPALAKALTEITLLKMSPDVRKHYDGLDESGKTSFLALSDTDQAETVAKANATDPVVYTTADGTEIRKSDGAAAAMMAKRLDSQAAEIAVLKSSRSADTLDRRAGEYPNVAKAVAVDLLKAADTAGIDTDAGKAVLKSLKAMNDSRGGVFKALGTTEAPEITGDVKKARTDFNAEVSKIMGRDKVGMADAMSKARDEQPALFAEAYPETAAADEDAE